MTKDRSAHKARMAARRERQLARTPGFTPVPNRRVDMAIAGETAKLIASGMGPVAALDLARVHIARTLPPIPIGVRWRGPRPSKSDAAAYRNRTAA